MKPERRHSSGQLPRPDDRTPDEAQHAQDSRRRALRPEPSERGRSVAQVASVLVCVVVITAYVQVGARRKAKPTAPVVPEAARGRRPQRPATRRRQPEPSRRPPLRHRRPRNRPRGGGAGTGRARCSQPRSRRADERAAQAAHRLGVATGQAALDASRARKLAFLVRDPSTRIAQASTRGGFLRGERDKVQKELSTLRQLPRPKSASILSKAPVAKPASGNEYHFELRHNRITFIDLERLMALTRADAQVRIRMSDRSPVVSNRVGPVGAFSLEYELVRAVAGSMEEMLERKNIRYELTGWELLSDSENRGETFEATRGPLSEFSLRSTGSAPNIDDDSVDLPGQLHALPPDSRRPDRARLQRGRPPSSRRHDHPRQPDGNAISGTVTWFTKSHKTADQQEQSAARRGAA